MKAGRFEFDRVLEIAGEPLIRDFFVIGNSCWFWFFCLDCRAWFAAPRVPFAIRWGMDAPHRFIRERTKCISCGRLGLQMQVPGFTGGAGEAQYETFPVEQGWCARVAARAEITERSA